jgi:hypothetical protein
LDKGLKGKELKGKERHMRVRIITASAVVCLACLAGQARAQQPGFTPQQLDEMSKQRMQAIGPRNWGPPPPQSSIPNETVLPTKQLWVCMSAEQWQPVYPQPNTSAPVIGKTMSQEAVSGRYVNGFARVLFGPGRIGYVPARELHPYVSKLRPGSTCTVEGVRPNGSPVFAYN